MIIAQIWVETQHGQTYERDSRTAKKIFLALIKASFFFRSMFTCRPVQNIINFLEVCDTQCDSPRFRLHYENYLQRNIRRDVLSKTYYTVGVFFFFPAVH